MPTVIVVTVGDLSSASPRRLPEGVVTFLFTDIEGSTQLLNRLGDAYGEVLGMHQRLLRSCFTAHDGDEVDTKGDAFFVAFSSARLAVAAAVDAQRALHAHRWPHDDPVRVRIGVHTGEPVVIDGNYVGMDVHRAARIASAGHGGQIVVSARLRDLVAEHLPEGVTVRDLGEHLLKDLPAPEHLFQLDIDGLPDTFPPLKSMRPPTNVPRRAAALVGRQRERRELAELITAAEVRLVTVTGPGGAGKTRLSGAVALDLLEEYPHGVYFVDLTPVTDPDDVVPAIARVLGVPLDGDEPAEDVLARHLGDRSMLLVLDNLEQVVQASLVVARLLQSCPRLTVLATSRFPLGLRDEQEYPRPSDGAAHGTLVRGRGGVGGSPVVRGMRRAGPPRLRGHQRQRGSGGRDLRLARRAPARHRAGRRADPALPAASPGHQAR